MCVFQAKLYRIQGLSMQDIALTILKGIFQTIIIFQENFKYTIIVLKVINIKFTS